MFIKKAGPLVAGAAIAIATVTAVAPTAGAAERGERRTAGDIHLPGHRLRTLDRLTERVRRDLPEEVAPGKSSPFSVQPGAMRNNRPRCQPDDVRLRVADNATIWA